MIISALVQPETCISGGFTNTNLWTRSFFSTILFARTQSCEPFSPSLLLVVVLLLKGLLKKVKIQSKMQIPMKIPNSLFVITLSSFRRGPTILRRRHCAVAAKVAGGARLSRRSGTGKVPPTLLIRRGAGFVLLNRRPIIRPDFYFWQQFSKAKVHFLYWTRLFLVHLVTKTCRPSGETSWSYSKEEMMMYHLQNVFFFFARQLFPELTKCCCWCTGKTGERKRI